MSDDPALVLAAVIALGIAAQWASWWIKLPAILPLLLIGLVAGPMTGWLDPDRLLGGLLFPLVSLGVAIILFEGALTLDVRELRGHGRVVTNLVTFGALVNWLIIAAGAWWFVGLDSGLALLFGALVTVTGPTVIVPMLRIVRPTATIASVLRWEGILIDPLGALLAVLVYEFIESGQRGQTLVLFGKTVAVGVALGLLGALLLAAVLRRHLVPEYLQDVVALALALGTFVLANAAVHEAGLLAVTVMGMALANRRDVNLEDILDFKESLTVLLISVLFILLAARVDLEAIRAVGLGGVGLLAVILFVARPIMVWLSAIGSRVTAGERALIAWIAPRGIVAAAVSALFALRLEQVGYPGATLLVGLTFTVIIVTVALQSATARPLARLLGVAEPEPRGILIAGGDAIALAVSKALTERDFRVLIADLSWTNLQRARMAGLGTYYGHIVSEHADRHLDLVGIGRLLAMTGRPAVNALACLRYRAEFGAGNVYALRTPQEREESDKRMAASALRCPRLFGEDVTHEQLVKLLEQGHEVRATRLTDTFDFAAYRAHHDGAAVPLFAVDRRERLHVFAGGRKIDPEPGWVVIGLVPPGDDTRKGAGRPAPGGKP